MRSRLALSVLTVLAVASCVTDGLPSAGSGQPSTAPLLVTAPTLPPDDQVGLTLYFRAGEGEDAHLQAVIHDVDLATDLARTAVELLIAGPQPDESGLKAVLPPTTVVHSVDIEGAVATVDLSQEVVTDAALVGASPTNEALALGAIANTLTEFPSVEGVQLRIDGRSQSAAAFGPNLVKPSAFWGGWGLPPVLVRDRSLIGAPPDPGDGVPDLGRFTSQPQELGARDAPPVALADVRVGDRLTHVRYTMELAPTIGDRAAGVPSAEAWIADDHLRLRIAGVAAYDGDFDAFSSRPVAEAPTIRSARVEAAGGGTVDLLVGTNGDPAYRLHTLANPTRIVLDIRKVSTP